MRARPTLRLWLAASTTLAALLLPGCGPDNRFVAPPPAKVTVVAPVQQAVTRYIEATGNTAAVNTTNLVARVSGFLQEINYKDGDQVKQGATLFTIEPEPYKLKLEQAQVDTKQAAINLGYTQVKAPFDGIVTARLVSLGELVGASGPTQLATIVETDPIYVNFNISEQEVLRVRAEIRRLGLTPADLKKVPVEVGLQSDEGYPYKGMLDYAAPTVSQSTGTLTVRAILQNPDRVLLPGYFVRVRVAEEPQNALLVPDVALGSDQGGRYVLVVNKDNVVEQRKVVLGPKVGELRAIDGGLKPDDRVVVAGIQRAIPGQKVEPQLQTAAATPAPAAGAK